MTDRYECETAILANLEWIRRAMASACRRQGTTGSDAEEFASWAMLKLIEDDYAVLRKFRGESAIRTYLGVVIATLHREYRVQRLGRWRASAAARRHGPVAIRLERLVYRDRMPLRQAVHVLRAAGATDASERQLVALYRKLPRRDVGRPIEVPDSCTDAPCPARADDLVSVAELAEERRAVETALTSALEALQTEERRIVRLHFVDGVTVADIARDRGLPQRPLYRRLERALATLRRSLESLGLTGPRVASCLAE